MAAVTGRLPSEWEGEEPAAIATVIQVLNEIHTRREADRGQAE